MSTSAKSGAPSRGNNHALAPNQSLYVQNLPESLQKEDLRRALYMLFSSYGPVLDVTALKTPKMRGQAHILFRDERAASSAMRGCQGFEFFGREMRIAYSKNRSNTLAKLRGTYDPPNAVNADAAKQAAPPTNSFIPPPGTLPAPPGTTPAPPTSLPAPPSGLPPPPGTAKSNDTAALKPPSQPSQDAPSPQGVKRAREDSDNDDGDASMEEDEGGEMDMSDDD